MLAAIYVYTPNVSKNILQKFKPLTVGTHRSGRPINTGNLNTTATQGISMVILAGGRHTVYPDKGDMLYHRKAVMGPMVTRMGKGEPPSYGERQRMTKRWFKALHKRRRRRRVPDTYPNDVCVWSVEVDRTEIIEIIRCGSRPEVRKMNMINVAPCIPASDLQIWGRGILGVSICLLIRA